MTMDSSNEACRRGLLLYYKGGRSGLRIWAVFVPGPGVTFTGDAPLPTDFAQPEALLHLSGRRVASGEVPLLDERGDGRDIATHLNVDITDIKAAHAGEPAQGVFAPRANLRGRKIMVAIKRVNRAGVAGQLSIDV